MGEQLGRGFHITPQFERHRTEIAQNALEAINYSLKAIDRDAATDSVANFKGLSQSRFLDMPDFVPLTDGVAIVWNTEGFLEYSAHRLVIGDDDRIIYHKEPFGEDCQKILSPTLDLKGFEQVITENEAVVGMLYASSLVMPQPGDSTVYG